MTNEKGKTLKAISKARTSRKATAKAAAEIERLEAKLDERYDDGFNDGYFIKKVPHRTTWFCLGYSVGFLPTLISLGRMFE
jgi:hypothetical protein